MNVKKVISSEELLAQSDMAGGIRRQWIPTADAIHPEVIFVFELPPQFYVDFCFTNQPIHDFRMVDWISAPSGQELILDTPKIGSDEWYKEMADFLKKKRYVKHKRIYIAVHPQYPFMFNSEGLL